MVLLQFESFLETFSEEKHDSTSRSWRLFFPFFFLRHILVGVKLETEITLRFCAHLFSWFVFGCSLQLPAQPPGGDAECVLLTVKYLTFDFMRNKVVRVMMKKSLKPEQQEEKAHFSLTLSFLMLRLQKLLLWFDRFTLGHSGKDCCVICWVERSSSALWLCFDDSCSKYLITEVIFLHTVQWNCFYLWFKIKPEKMTKVSNKDQIWDTFLLLFAFTASFISWFYFYLPAVINAFYIFTLTPLNQTICLVLKGYFMTMKTKYLPHIVWRKKLFWFSDFFEQNLLKKFLLWCKVLRSSFY